MIFSRLSLLPILFLALASPVHAAPLPATISGGQYADNPACLFEFWKATDPSKPAPLLIFIHGGGLIGGNRMQLAGLAEPCLKKGYAVMTITYPFLPERPVQSIMHLIARSVQYARAHAREWNIDPSRIVCIGGSAGASASLWIATHPDLADPDSPDPVARQSSRISAAGLLDTQATFNVYRWPEVMGYPEPLAKLDFYSPISLYHIQSNDPIPSDSPEFQSMLKDVDMYEMISASTPPLIFRSKPKPDGSLDQVHSARHAQAIIERAKDFGVVTDFKSIPEGSGNHFLDIVAYFDTHPIQPVP